MRDERNRNHPPPRQRPDLLRPDARRRSCGALPPRLPGQSALVPPPAPGPGGRRLPGSGADDPRLRALLTAGGRGLPPGAHGRGRGGLDRRPGPGQGAPGGPRLGRAHRLHRGGPGPGAPPHLDHPGHPAPGAAPAGGRPEAAQPAPELVVHRLLPAARCGRLGGGGSGLGAHREALARLVAGLDAAAAGARRREGDSRPPGREARRPRLLPGGLRLLVPGSAEKPGGCSSRRSASRPWRSPAPWTAAWTHDSTTSR